MTFGKRDTRVGEGLVDYLEGGLVFPSSMVQNSVGLGNQFPIPVARVVRIPPGKPPLWKTCDLSRADYPRSTA